MTLFKQTTEVINRLKNVTSKADLTGEHTTITELEKTFVPQWVAGTTYKSGNIVLYNQIKYLVLQQVTASTTYPPDMPNGAMLAVYKPYQATQGVEWIYGEYSLRDYIRTYQGSTYKAVQDPGANIYPPPQVPAIWQLVESV